ncbi:hypothetical protein DSAG12_02886 [Promethearchaeum syntrophicum]|uniref:Histidine kinase N-terminal 7TM region domain-containing protein n=1 Tax=Promethearchaeum syntrophicum TaxID=2594042 RepID=A0A5B9DD46_9ARCH|nr:hypothetical protein [Candidatus Prometheoarchaeum syntrophicum]
MFISILARLLSLLLEFELFFEIHILTVIPSTYFGILVIDMINRFSLDPVKIFIFGVCSTGVIFCLFNPNCIIELELSSGEKSFRPGNSLNIWLLIMISITISYLLYNFILIFKRTPPNLRKTVKIICGSSILFGIVTVLFFIFRMTDYVPGLEMLTLSLGSFIFSISFLKSPEIIKFVIKSGEISKLKYINKIFPICSKCKKIRDNEGNWQHLEDYFLHNSDIRFSHGLCPQCEEEFLTDLEKD